MWPSQTLEEFLFLEGEYNIRKHNAQDALAYNMAKKTTDIPYRCADFKVTNYYCKQCHKCASHQPFIRDVSILKALYTQSVKSLLVDFNLRVLCLFFGFICVMIYGTVLPDI